MSERIKFIDFSPKKGKAVTHQNIEQGEYTAEFFVNYNTTPPIYHYIVTRKGSRAIEIWGQTFTEESCINEATGAIDQLALRRVKVAR